MPHAGTRDRAAFGDFSAARPAVCAPVGRACPTIGRPGRITYGRGTTITPAVTRSASAGACWKIRGVIRPGEKSQADEQSRLEALRSVLRSARLQAGSGESRLRRTAAAQPDEESSLVIALRLLDRVVSAFTGGLRLESGESAVVDCRVVCEVSRYGVGGFGATAGAPSGRRAAFRSLPVTPAFRSATSLMRSSSDVPRTCATSDGVSL